MNLTVRKERMQEPTPENMKAMHEYRTNQLRTEACAVAPSKRDRRPRRGILRRVRRIYRVIRGKFTRQDFDLESWRRIEFRNEYRETRKPQHIDIYR